MQQLNNYYEDYFSPIEVAEGTFMEGVWRHITKMENRKCYLESGSVVKL